MKKNIIGFTLLEIIIVVVILGIIASLALPRLMFSLERARAGEAIQILETLRKAQHLYKYENGSFTGNINDLDVTIPSPSYFNAPSINVGDPIAVIQRQGGGYFLRIDEDGTISCINDPTTCTKLGY